MNLNQIQIELRNTNSTERLNIGIIGAGICGITSAYELAKLGHNVTVFEASNRVGGRLYTHRFNENPDEYYFELGGTRIPSSHDYVHHYIKLVGLENKLVPHVVFAQNTNSPVCIRNHVSTTGNYKSQITPLYNLNDNEKQYIPNALFSNIVGKELELLTTEDKTKIMLGSTDSARIQRLNHLSLRGLLEEHVSGLEAINYIGIGIGGIGFLDRSSLLFIRDMIMNTPSSIYELKGGVDKLVQKLQGLAEDEGVEVFLNSAVTQVINKSDSIELVISEIENKKFDYVICTVTAAVMRRIKLSNVKPQLEEAIAATSYLQAIKIGVLFQNRFWEQKHGVYAGASFTDKPFRQLCYPSNINYGDVKAKTHVGKFCMSDSAVDLKAKTVFPENTPGLLYSYVYGQDATSMASLSDEEVLKVFQLSWESIFPEVNDRKQILEYKVFSWTKDKWFAGAVNLPEAGMYNKYFECLTSIDKRLVVAGEHASPYSGWIQGSLWSALNACKEILGDWQKLNQ